MHWIKEIIEVIVYGALILIPIIYLIRWAFKRIDENSKLWIAQREIQMQKYSDFEKEHLNNQAFLLVASFILVFIALIK